MGPGWGTKTSFSWFFWVLWRTSHFDFAFSESDSLEGLGARLLRFLVEKESKEKNAMAVDASNHTASTLKWWLLLDSSKLKLSWARNVATHDVSSVVSVLRLKLTLAAGWTNEPSELSRNGVCRGSATEAYDSINQTIFCGLQLRHIRMLIAEIVRFGWCNYMYLKLINEQATWQKHHSNSIIFIIYIYICVCNCI